MTTQNDRRVNIGLCLKYDSKNLQVLGYARKSDKGWEYSTKAVSLIQKYKVIFI